VEWWGAGARRLVGEEEDVTTTFGEMQIG